MVIINRGLVCDRFPTESACIQYLEAVRWNGSPVCPYCGSCRSTRLVNVHRHHCNNCNTTYSVKVKTLFHQSRVPLQTWFYAIALILNTPKTITARQLACMLAVNKDTAWFLTMRIQDALGERSQRELLHRILHAVLETGA